MKVKRYIDATLEQHQELRELTKQYKEIPSSESLKERNIHPSLHWLSSLKDKIAEFEPDISNNGGTRTVLTKTQLENLIKRGNELTNVYFLKIYDIKESFNKEEKVSPNFLSDDIKKQLNNPEYNSWHKSLLKRNN